MHLASTRSYIVLSSLFLIVLVALLIGFRQFPASVQAQTSETLAWGEPQLGEVTGPAGIFYSFQGHPGDIATLHVLGIGGFKPTLTLFDENQNVLLQEDNLTGNNVIQVSYTLLYDGTYRVQIRGASGSLGQFTIVLERNLPPGIPLVENVLTLGTLAPDNIAAYYDFATHPTLNALLEVRSQTPGYSPVIAVFDAAGEILAALNSKRLAAAVLEFGPSSETLKLAVEHGDFATEANFTVLLRYGPLAASIVEPASTAEPDSIPQAAVCFVTPRDNNDVNVRAGGSTSHAPVGILRFEASLPVIGFNLANGGWYAVHLPNGGTGWVAAAVVSAAGDCTNLPILTYASVPASTEEPGPGPQITPAATDDNGHDDEDD
jgi:uncharacterized protein YraI